MVAPNLFAPESSAFYAMPSNSSFSVISSHCQPTLVDLSVRLRIMLVIVSGLYWIREGLTS